MAIDVRTLISGLCTNSHNRDKNCSKSKPFVADGPCFSGSDAVSSSLDWTMLSSPFLVTLKPSFVFTSASISVTATVPKPEVI